MKRYIIIFSVLFVLVSSIVVLNTRAALGDAYSPINDVFNNELQPTEAMSLVDCDFWDQGIAVIDRIGSNGGNYHGEQRRFISSATGNFYTVDIEALTSQSCPLKTKRTRWGDTTGTLTIKLRYQYDIYPRAADCGFLPPIRFSATSCPTSSLIAQICPPIQCPEGSQQGAYPNCECENISPIVLQMNHGARFDISTTEQGILFDLNSDGTLEKISSPLDSENVGFLYLANELDHNGRNLFGNLSPQPTIAGIKKNGFIALAQWDDNSAGGGNVPDGKITKLDAVWRLLSVWFDRNRNGLKDAGELLTLDQLNINQLDLDYVTSDRNDGHDNDITFTAKFWKTGDTSPYFMADYFAKIKKL